MVSILADFKLAGWVIHGLSTRSCQQQVEPNFHSLLSAHYLIGAYFLTAESDKRMCLLTRLYTIRYAVCVNKLITYNIMYCRNLKMPLKIVMLLGAVPGPTLDSTPGQGTPALETLCSTSYCQTSATSLSNTLMR